MFVTAVRDIKKGERITRPFQSNYTNLDLMEKFGFIVPDNPNKRIKLNHLLLRKDPLLDQKYEALGQGDTFTRFQFFIDD